jgi:hydroxylamine dehydrogenase
MGSRSRFLVTLCGWILIAAFLAILSRSSVLATVDYARQTGQPCSTCHTRPEGGGELTPLGVAYARGGYQWPVPEDLEVYTPSNWARTLRLITGYLHVTVTAVWFGTIFYIHIVVRPQQLTTGIPRTEGIIGWISIAVVLVTGVGLTIFRYLETGSVFTGTFGTVFIIKLAQFALMVTLALIATVFLSRRLRQPKRPVEAPPSAPGEVTAEALPSLDGKDGSRAVVAVEGRLYDVSESRLWRDGVHVKKHRAGQDLTEALKGAPHGAEVLDRMPAVGELGAAPAEAGPRRPPAMRVFIAFTYTNLALLFGILLCVAWWKWGFSWRAESPSVPGPAQATISEPSSDCIACHSANEFLGAQIGEWRRGAHAQAQVGCYECHSAEDGDPDAMAHNGYTISVLVTPNDCAGCHVLEAEQFATSRHSRGGDILDSLDNVLGEQVEGLAAAVIGCQQCHGAPVEVLADGTLSPASWPNTGIGRINPDGSRGACSTCHTRHLFSVAVAREPDSCGNCHLGPDHPQKEIYEESKHGIAFVANREHMNLEADPWVLGQDYTAAPTCATCHMSAVPGISTDHDVGLRIAWTLRPVVSPRLEDWEEKRDSMAQTCRQCHSPGFYGNFFVQFDDAVDLYNEKFAVPAQQIMERLREAGALTDLDFDEQIEWTFFLLWHHEGRRARHGAAMMGPDYVQWHGFFEVVDRFYNEFVPQAEALLPGVTQPFLQDEYHQWRMAGQRQ